MKLYLKVCGSSSSFFASQQMIKNRHANRDAVGDLIQNHALRAIGDFIRNLDAAINRAGMHQNRVGFRQFQALAR